MTTTQFTVLSQEEIERIHAASMEVLATVGVKVDWGPAREIFGEAGADVDDEAQCVRIPEKLVRWAVDQAPQHVQALWLGPRLLSGHRRRQHLFCRPGYPHPHHRRRQWRAPAIHHGRCGPPHPAHQRLPAHPQLADGRLAQRHPHDHHPQPRPSGPGPITAAKPFGMGCYGYLPTLDMMRMMAIVSGGKEELRRRPTFFAICSVGSPLQMIQMQLEGLLICADYGQPLAMSPEAIAGATAPVTLAGLLVQQNANILAHVTLAQIYRPGTPVLYGTVSTIANMRLGTVALGAVETGLITAGAAQMARYYGLPCRSVGGCDRVQARGPAGRAGADRHTAARRPGRRQLYHLRRHPRRHHAGKRRPADAGR